MGTGGEGGGRVTWGMRGRGNMGMGGRVTWRI